MSKTQKIIKYFAIALAVLIIFSILSLISRMIMSMGGIFDNDKSSFEEYIIREWTLSTQNTTAEGNEVSSESFNSSMSESLTNSVEMKQSLTESMKESKEVKPIVEEKKEEVISTESMTRSRFDKKEEIEDIKPITSSEPEVKQETKPKDD